MTMYEVTIEGRMYVSAETEDEAIAEASKAFVRVYDAEAYEL